MTAVQPPKARRVQRNPLAALSFWLGLISFVGLFFVYPLPLPGGVAAIVLGARGRRVARAHDGDGRAMATTGIVLGAISLVIELVYTLLLAYWLSHISL